MASLPFRQLLITLFLFFYVPLAYYYGWILPDTIGIDFPSYFYGAHLAFVEHRTPYGLTVFDGLKGFMGGKVQPYFYPPPSLLAFWPLAQMSLWHARSLFIIVSHVCYLASIWVIIARLTPLPEDIGLRRLTIALSMVYMLCFNPALDSLGTGQVNFVALLFICLALSGLRHCSPSWRVALPLSIAILLKTYPVLLLLPLLFRKRYRAVALTCCYFAVFTLISVLVLPKTVWHSWVFEVVPLGGYGNNQIPAAYCWNQSLNAFIIRLFKETYFSKAPLLYPSLAKPVATTLALTFLSITTYFSFRASRRASDKLAGDYEIAAYLLMIYIIAPLSWDHHLVYVLPAAVLAIRLVLTGGVRGKSAVAMTGLIMLMAWRYPVDRLDIVNGWWTLLMSVKLYVVLALWGFFILRLSRIGRNFAVDRRAGIEDATFTLEQRHAVSGS